MPDDENPLPGGFKRTERPEKASDEVRESGVQGAELPDRGPGGCPPGPKKVGREPSPKAARDVADKRKAFPAHLEKYYPVDRPRAVDSVSPTVYDRRYFQSSCEGYQDFRASSGKKLGARFQKALELARVRPDERVLDVGCGRGEMVFQSALRGAHAIGIDYSEDAVAIAADALSTFPREVQERASILHMNACRMDFPDASFDLVIMSDIVEHLYPPELREVLSETARALRPDGRLVVHTCPNRLLYDYTYRVYVRHVHRWFRRLAELTRYRSFTIGPMLSTGPEHPRTATERQVHVNEQTPRSLRTALEEAGMRVSRTLYWEMPNQLPYVSRLLTAELMVLDSFRYLRPTSYAWPLNRLFANHIWMVARKP